MVTAILPRSTGVLSRWESGEGGEMAQLYFYSSKENRDQKVDEMRRQGRQVRCRTYRDQRLSPLHVEDAEPHVRRQLLGLDMYWEKLYCAEAEG